MMLKVVATLCQLVLSPSADAPGDQNQPARCEDVTQFVGEGDLASCMMSMPKIAEWKEQDPKYAGPTWTVTRVRCYLGKPAGTIT
jgi:hypothetical protein